MALVVAVVAMSALACSGGGNAAAPAATAAPAPPPTSVDPTTAPPTTPTTTTAAPTSTTPTAPVSADLQVASVTFVSNDTGWVLGTEPCSSGTCTAVVKTTDRGATWTSVAAPPAPPAAPGASLGDDDPQAISGLRFADESNGFAYGPSYWVTHDSGATWAQPADLAGLAPYTVDEVAAVGGEIYLVVVASDSTEHVVRGDPATDGSYTIVGDFGPDAIAIPGLIPAGPDVYVQTDDDQVARIHEGVLGAFSALPDTACEVAASSADDLLAACGEGVGGGAMGDRHLYGTTDAGATWQQLADPGIGAGYDAGGVADGGGGHAAIVTSSVAASSLLVTDDFAQHWREVLRIGVDDSGYYHDVGYEDTDHAVVLLGQPGTLYLSDDGGLTWRAATFG